MKDFLWTGKVGALLLALLVVCLPGEAAAQAGTILKVAPECTPAGPGEEANIAIRVENVSDLSAFSLQVAFDPGDVEVLEASNGGFLEDGFVPVNEIDNTAGRIRFDMAQMGGTAQSGSGDLMLVRLRLREAGRAADIAIDPQASSLVKWPEVQPIPYVVYGGRVGVCGWPLYLPLLIRTW